MSADNYFITDQNAIYFLTFTIEDWIDVFTRKEYKVVIADSLNDCIENKGQAGTNHKSTQPEGRMLLLTF